MLKLSDDLRRRFDAAASLNIAAEEAMELQRQGQLHSSAVAEHYQATACAVSDLLLEAQRSHPGLAAVRSRGRIWQLVLNGEKVVLFSTREATIGE